MYPTKDHIMQFFAYEHLPPHLQEVSKKFCEMAESLVKVLPRNPERTVALRKLLEGKDAAVRALVSKEKSCTVLVVVNGQTVAYTLMGKESLSSMCSKILKEHGKGSLSTPDYLQDWEVRDVGGTLLLFDSIFAAADFQDGFQLFLSPRPGVGG